MPKVDNLAKGWIGSVGAKTGAAVVHAAEMPTQYILVRESMQVQRDGAMADVKMLPAFTAKYKTSAVDGFQDNGLSVDWGCRQASRQAAVVRQVAQDRGAVVRQTPYLVQRHGLPSKKKLGRKASAQRNHLYIRGNSTFLTAEKPQEHAEVRGVECQKCATTRGGCRPHPIRPQLILEETVSGIKCWIGYNL